ncbi:GTPase ObgE [Thermoanaerobacter brockii subsp. lactiethylicus]|uniref:GTPase Obg n=3 Tax=Thermoanaerobacter TaxID=1754 RepID=OBG_THEP3|nr:MULTISPECIES: GTPase ObgE [Thermoanaerobacter]B0K414.1 RecName: Full=GTPase Obg; AltName: Full=GTP-binding protein Obg [Thermoanaerobacter sp. X514]B0KAB8.1 RecName: Full=GTPase Obg; AltName: Full=GTP-binding protein Obg [Thermoanaerobacter pseudethanolicus ATCC 33223]ABY93385.1 small GTP-binding protein [Thermoanaerobacter sp. X514]ABY95081.1 small GTP-binding protein [Thermoanaerobacter pseudethanolicus ATCC 33223]ADV80032.1 GTP-binding protein Obg/CgtA [Thermoanaerobacter brockii subsp. 
MFIDTARIYIKAGDGGNGIISFRREKYVAYGGPDGGDGGKGGDVIFIADPNLSTLLDFKYRKKYIAQNGENGRGKNQYGKNGEDLYIKVPVGTLIINDETGEIIADLVKPNQKAIVLRGGKGGRGNAKFATPTLKTPRFAESGEKGKEMWVRLELKLLADVGLIGFPNAGKSTLLASCTRAKPKIANYPFTTLTPNLGVVEHKGKSFVMADIPGLIEGAHRGEGLGHDFLRHIERTKMLIHVVDVSASEGRDPIEDFEKINEELKLYSERLLTLSQIVAANKIDIQSGKENFPAFEKEIKKRGYEVYPISALTKVGIDKLLDKTIEILSSIPVEEIKEVPEVIVYTPPEEEETLNIEVKDNTYYLSGTKIDKLLKRVNLQDEHSLRYFEMLLRKSGVIDALKEKGFKSGDTINVRDFEFEYYE